MREYLQKLIDENKNEPVSIGQICESDAKIILSLIKIFGLIGFSELKDILNNWKDNIPDEEVLYKLEEFIKNGSIPFVTITKIGDCFFDLKLLKSISLIDTYDNKNKMPLYKIILNKDDSEKIYLSNFCINFYSLEKRELALCEFKEKTKYLGIKYI